MNILSHISNSQYFNTFNRKEWNYLQNKIPLKLSQQDILNLICIYNISINEISEIYLPLSKLLNAHITYNFKKNNTIMMQSLKIHHIPYIIGITGSVAAGKSTTAKILKILLSKWFKYRTIEIVTTDGFLYSNQVLKRKHLMKKKGFPQSYDIYNLKNFITKIKSGIQPIVTVPIYSHITYDIIRDLKKNLSTRYFNFRRTKHTTKSTQQS